MIATIVNAVAVVIGTVVGRFSGKTIGERFRHTIFSGIGVVSLLIGIYMALETQRTLYLVLSIALGGLIGAALGVEDRIYAFGEWLKRRFYQSKPSVRPSDGDALPGALPGAPATSHNFAEGFLVASVLFCVGALTIIGAFRAGVEQEYGLLFTKSVMDGFMAILLTTAYGVGVGFAAIPILVYQGGLTLLAGVLAPYVSPLMLSEISGVGGAMVVMIGINLLELRTIKTGDFLPGIVVVVLFVLLDPVIGPYVM
ncbi:MAG: DUF554 domain-containing protein [Alkalispirochaeta sp.]